MDCDANSESPGNLSHAPPSNKVRCRLDFSQPTLDNSQSRKPLDCELSPSIDLCRGFYHRMVAAPGSRTCAIMPSKATRGRICPSPKWLPVIRPADEPHETLAELRTVLHIVRLSPGSPPEDRHPCIKSCLPGSRYGGLRCPRMVCQSAVGRFGRPRF